MSKARDEAMRRGVSLQSLLEQGLLMLLNQQLQHPACSEVELPACTAGGGLLPGVDLNDSTSLFERMDARE
jgi:hypothetical protein